MNEQYQAGYKLRDLKTFLDAVLGQKMAKGLEVEMTNIELILTPKNMGHGFVIMNQRYMAEIYIDRLPFNKYNPAVLFANVGAWLMDNDSQREDNDNLDDPEIEVTIDDEDSAEILINVHFEEPVKIIENPEGDIYWRNKRWSIEEYEIWVAKKLVDVVNQ